MRVIVSHARLPSVRHSNDVSVLSCSACWDAAGSAPQLGPEVGIMGELFFLWGFPRELYYSLDSLRVPRDPVMLEGV